MSKLTPKKDGPSKQQKKSKNVLKERKSKTSTTEIAPDPCDHEVELRTQNAELLKTQEKLKVALAEYSELFELCPVGYFILDKDGIIEKANIRGTVQLGFDRERLIHKPFSTFLHTEPDQDNFHRHVNRAIEDGNLERMECEIKRKDGAVFPAFIKSKIIKDEKLRFKHLLSVMTDMSQIKEHEHQIELQLTRSEELSTLKSRFIGMASHEFRTPLTSMLSSVSLIEQYAQTDDTAKMKKHLTRIKASIKSLVTTLDEFLSIEKLESGAVEIQTTNFDLAELCTDLVEEVAAVRKKGQVVCYQHNGDKEIVTDRKVLQHIILNLLSNGCKYSPEEKEIKLFTDVSGDEITIIVEDSGIGIPDAEQASIFTRFFRAQNTENIQGTGLGLTIVKRYVELLNGTIGFVSKHNEGTTFTVTFPQIPGR